MVSRYKISEQINELKLERMEENSNCRQGWGSLAHSLANSTEKQIGHCKRTDLRNVTGDPC